MKIFPKKIKDGDNGMETDWIEIFGRVLMIFLSLAFVTVILTGLLHIRVDRRGMVKECKVCSCEIYEK